MTCLFYVEMKLPYGHISEMLVIGMIHCVIITLCQLAFGVDITTLKLSSSKQQLFI